jgi:hypothetical protein
MLFVGVDPSLTNTGVVCLDGKGNLVAVGNSKDALQAWRSQSAETRNCPEGQTYRLKLIKDYVITVISHAKSKVTDTGFAVFEKTVIYYEDYSFDSLNRAFSLGELGGVLKTELMHMPLWDCNLYLAPPKTVKKFAINRGDCTKKEPIMTRAKDECPALSKVETRSMTSDVCDAYFLAKMAWYRTVPELVIEHETHKDLLRNRLEIVKGKIHG